MKKQRVLLVSRNLAAGGIESSSIRFVENMKNYVDLEVFLCCKQGILSDSFAKDVKTYEGNKIIQSLSRPFENVNNATKTKNKLFGLVKKIMNFLHLKEFLWEIGVLFTKKIKKEYDCVICFYSQFGICNKITLKKVKAKQKIAVIHADVSKYKLPKNTIKYLKKFDKVLCVSKSCAEIFKKKFPQYSNKVDYLYNFQDVDKIISKSEDFLVEFPKTSNIITVARLSEEEKGILRSLRVFKKLHDEGYKFHWHVIGSGLDKFKIDDFIKNNNMDDYVTLLGAKSNPYPYIKSADIFYLGSYHEAAPMVFAEAMVLKTPVISTNTSSSKELVGDYGWICENDENEIYLKLKYILENKEEIQIKMKKLNDYKWDNEIIVNKLLKLIDEGKKED